MPDNNYDVAVIGGGPGGSATAALTAVEGYRVLLLDKEVFPRYQAYCCQSRPTSGCWGNLLRCAS